MDIHSTFDIQTILNYLPHRYPFLLVDKIIHLSPKKSIVGIKNVTINEPFFQGHFPNQPIMPGVLLLEAMVQVSGILALYEAFQKDKNTNLYMLVTINKAKFQVPVVPGDQLYLESKVASMRGPFIKCNTLAKVQGKIVCSAEIMGIKRPSLN